MSTPPPRTGLPLFAAFERRDGAMTVALVEQYGVEALLNGMGSVCSAFALHYEHALECCCGSDSWLEQELYDIAKGD